MDFVVVPIYCGSNFRRDSGDSNFKAFEMDDAILSLCNFTEYFEGMRQFGAQRIESGPLGNIAIDDIPVSWSANRGSPGFKDDEIRTVITNHFNANPSIAPSAFPGKVPVYVVVIKQGQKSQQRVTSAGWHDTLDWQGSKILWAWVYQGDNLGGTTPTVAHEIVEAIASHLGYGERCDPCQSTTRSTHDIRVDPYLDLFGHCITPGAVRDAVQTMGTPVCMAWKDADSAAVCWSTISSWPSSDDDQHTVTKWDHPGTIQNVGTSHSPAVRYFDGKVWMVWKGIDPDPQIWWSYFEHGVWRPQQTIRGAGTSGRPALAVFDGFLHCVWKGLGNDSAIWFSRYKGGDFWDQQETIPRRATSHGVSLLTGQSLHKFWKGAGNDATIWWSRLPHHSTTWTEQVATPGMTSDTPAVALIGTAGTSDRVLLTWKGADNDTTIWQCVGDGASWTQPQAVPGVATSCGPAVIGDGGGNLWRVWRGAGNDTAIWWSSSTDKGSHWSPQQTIMDSIGTWDGLYNARTSHQPSLVMIP